MIVFVCIICLMLLIHAYFDINLDILWQTVTEDLKPLIIELEKALLKEK